MKPKIFVGSSKEGLDVAYAIQSSLEDFAEVTVWDQGVFQPSKFTIDSILSSLDNSDFGIFVFSPDDIIKIRDQQHLTVRDNVLFELRIFVGRLGIERNFIFRPKTITDFRLPTDLLGITLLSFDPDREDKNLKAAVGPAVSDLRNVINKLRGIEKVDRKLPNQSEDLSENDIISTIQSWMGSREASLNTKVIKYSDVDDELRLAAGSAEK